MKQKGSGVLWLWAVRDLSRRPWDALLTAAVIWLLIAVAGTMVLLTFSLSGTAEKVLENAPAIVVRRVDTGGWVPIPVDEAAAIACKTRGVTGVRPRVWGIVRASDGPVTAIAWDEETRKSLGSQKLPEPGEALAADGISASDGGTISLQGSDSLVLNVTGRFKARTDIAAARTLLLHPDDARRLLGLDSEVASDLALSVFHDGEADALLPELSDAFPWPVRLTTRRQAIERYSAGYARRGGLVMTTAIPCFLAMVLLVAATVRDRLGSRRECGLLKALGWTAGDIVRIQVFRALTISLPAVALGWISAWTAVFFPGISWPGALFFGWESSPPALYLDSSGAVFPLVAITSVVMLPYAAAVLFPALKAAASHPGDLMEEEWTI